jgi:hypothetical protein
VAGNAAKPRKLGRLRNIALVAEPLRARKGGPFPRAKAAYSSSAAKTFPVLGFTRWTRRQATQVIASKVSPSLAGGSSANQPCTFRLVLGHR